MKESKNKIEKATGSKLFFLCYLLFFGVALFMAATSDVIFPDKIITFNGEERYDECFSQGILMTISIVHLLGGIVFFIRLVVSKLEIPE